MGSVDTFAQRQDHLQFEFIILGIIQLRYCPKSEEIVVALGIRGDSSRICSHECTSVGSKCMTFEISYGKAF
jgi:hypothetical protein